MKINESSIEEFVKKCLSVKYIKGAKEIHIGEDLYEDIAIELKNTHPARHFFDVPVFKNKNLPKRDIHVFEQLNHGYEKWPDTDLTFEQYTYENRGRIIGSKFGL